MQKENETDEIILYDCLNCGHPGLDHVPFVIGQCHARVLEKLPVELEIEDDIICDCPEYEPNRNDNH